MKGNQCYELHLFVSSSFFVSSFYCVTFPKTKRSQIESDFPNDVTCEGIHVIALAYLKGKTAFFAYLKGKTACFVGAPRFQTF